MDKKNLIFLFVAIGIVVVSALITANITGMITTVYSTSETYTKSEMDIKLKNVSAADCLRYNNCDVHNLNLIPLFVPAGTPKISNIFTNAFILNISTVGGSSFVKFTRDTDKGIGAELLPNKGNLEIRTNQGGIAGTGNITITTGLVRITGLQGTSKAYACINFDGSIYRSTAPCV